MELRKRRVTRGHAAGRPMPVGRLVLVRARTLVLGWARALAAGRAVRGRAPLLVVRRLAPGRVRIAVGWRLALGSPLLLVLAAPEAPGCAPLRSRLARLLRGVRYR